MRSLHTVDERPAEILTLDLEGVAGLNLDTCGVAEDRSPEEVNVDVARSSQ